MIIKNKADNEAILSNVGQVGEFRIRNSAKAFNILSSGLYANKIRAIIREYSCNAVDSHVEAGRGDVPFDVHLPTALEPWFAIRDYGVGLDEGQVRNIFTTYFESTKTETDDLIGGLGLGSKSAFSFTDNFTIVAVKNGMKRVYTAFINEQGVPSIAPMGEEETTDPAGVEIRFAVEDSWDFRKFYNEAQHVYKHFKLRPVVSGVSDFKFIDPEYLDRDIIPGVHSSDRGYGSSVAIMGNIEYPLDVPSNMDLGDVGRLLRCGLTIEFAIGELDIQASREGLSYIPETVAAIKAKLEALNAVLADKIADEADKIKNKWERAYFLDKRMNNELWIEAVKKYIADTKFDLITPSRYGATGKVFRFTEKALAERFNIKVSVFTVHSGWQGRSTSNFSMENHYNNQNNGYEKLWPIPVDASVNFVENDTNVGSFTRAKYHWRNDGSGTDSGDRVYVLERADKKKDMNLKGFYRAISNPPASQKRKASTLLQKERAVGIGKDVTILNLEKRDNKGHMRSNDMVWRDAGALESFDNATTYYYLPLSGFQCLGAAKHYDMKTFVNSLRNSGIFTGTVYGVRKADLEEVQSRANWINLDDHIQGLLATAGKLDHMGIIKKAIDADAFFGRFKIADRVNADSPYVKFYNLFKDVTSVSAEARRGFEVLCSIYKIDAGNVNVTDEINKYENELNDLRSRYPLLNELTRYYGDDQAVADYVNAIDMLKGI